MPNWSRGGRFYGASERSSRAISGRIALIQLYFYGTAAASILVSGGLFGMPLDVWQILDPSALSLFSSHGICAVFATAVAYGSATVCMPSVVQRAKLVADYAFTVFAIHLLLCSVCAVSLGARASRDCAWRHASQGGCQGALAHHAFRVTGVGRWSRALLHGALWVRLSLLIAEWLGGFPVSWQWWAVNGVGALCAGVAGERLCLAEEMRDIDVEPAADGHRDQQVGQERRGSEPSAEALRGRRERRPAPGAELQVTVVGGDLSDLSRAGAVPGGAANARGGSSAAPGVVVWPEKAPSTPSRRPVRAGPNPPAHGSGSPQHAPSSSSPLRAVRLSGGSQTELVALSAGRASSASPSLVLGPPAAEMSAASSPTTMLPRPVADAASMAASRTPSGVTWSSQQSAAFASPPSPGRAESPRAAVSASSMLEGMAALLTPATKTTRQRTGGSSSGKA
ncbi:unnamed protein product [Symbiodinium sp. KB8]|nr:unnamed protein product [Symbiodinium sp. KB8]